MFNLDGRTALITGGSGGIGVACAKTLSSLGAKVIISGTNEERLNHTANLIGNGCKVIRADLADPAQCKALIDQVEGNLDILVSNAGITDDTLAIRMKDESFDKVINVNLKASFILNRESAKRMLKQRYGRIINISSVVAFTGNFGQCNYSASKAGLVAMSKSLALEIASRGVTVNVVAPGFISTNMTKALSEEIKAELLKKIPLGRYGAPEEIADMVAFLASDKASYITGQTFHVNGGMLML